MKRPFEDRTESSGSACSEQPKKTKDGGNQSSPKVHSGFRISPVVELFGNFSSVKKRILEKMHFNGLMELPKGESQYDRPFKLQFAFWLLLKIDPVTGVLDLGKRGSFRIRDEDAGLVLGLLSKGDEIVEHDHSQLERNQSIVKRNLMLDDTEELDLDNIRKVLKRDISAENSEQDTKAFMTAVALYAVSYFLAPKGRPPKVNTEILDSITDPDSILRINWSSYVIKTIKESSSKIKSDIVAGKKSVCLDGCLLFLQIVYLDNMRLGNSKTNRWKTPRVGAFSYDILNSLIIMDKNKGCHGRGETYGKLEMLQDSESIYSRGMEARNKSKGKYKEETRSSTNYDIDSVLRQIEKENNEHKRKVRKAAYDFAEQLCSLSDQHCDYVKTMMERCMRGNLYNDTADDTQDNDKDEENMQHKDKDTDHEDQNRSFQPERTKKRKSETQKQPEFIDITDSDDEEERHTVKKRFSDKDGIRCGYKRTANRTPLAVRRAMLSKNSGQGSYQDQEQSDIQRRKGVYMEKQTAEAHGEGKNGRTKHIATRERKGKVANEGEQYSEDSGS